MAYSDPERERVFQEAYRAANVERRKQYDRDYYERVTKPKRLAAKQGAVKTGSQNRNLEGRPPGRKGYIA